MNVLSLATAKESELFTIKAIKASPKLRTRLLGMGLGVGIDIGVLRNRRGDVVLGSGNTRISLSREISRKIVISPLGKRI
ncbi:MAG: ferrous iron transport protein A [Cocleimonas sp.]|nr:ferrous iron transport protein A [Cocleimonas sp.]